MMLCVSLPLTMNVCILHVCVLCIVNIGLHFTNTEHYTELLVSLPPQSVINVFLPSPIYPYTPHTETPIYIVHFNMGARLQFTVVESISDKRPSISSSK